MPKTSAGLALATACDKHYFLTAVNLIGSVQKNSDLFQKIYIADLGLSGWQKKVLNNIRGVTVLTIEPFAPHWQKCWSWKPWVWNAINSDYLLYLDAGIEVLHNLGPMYEFIQRDEYFLVSQNAPGGNHVVKSIMPTSYYNEFNLPQSQGKQDVIGAGIIGFKRDSTFFNTVIKPELQFSAQGFCLGWSKAEASRNQGIDYMDNPPVRDCEMFRHDQTVLNALIYKNFARPVVHPLQKYANYASPNEYPNQLLWHHRRQSQLPWISQVYFTRFGAILMPILQLMRQWRRLKRRLTGRQLP